MRLPTRVTEWLAQILGVVLGIGLLMGPAAATHDSLPCSVPSALNPLFQLLDTFVQIALLGGVTLGTLGFSIAGIMVLWPGQDMTRRGKDVAKHVIIGVVILLSAQGIVSFITSQLGTTICGG